MLTLAELGEISKGLPSALKQLERTVGGDLTKIKDPAIRERILAHRAGRSASYATAAGHPVTALGARQTGQAARQRGRDIMAGYQAGGPRVSDVAAAKKRKIKPWMLAAGGTGLAAAGGGAGYAAGSRD